MEKLFSFVAFEKNVILQVVTLRFRDFHEYELKKLGPSHREIMLAFNNSDGRLPFVSKVPLCILLVRMTQLALNI